MKKPLLTILTLTAVAICVALPGVKKSHDSALWRNLTVFNTIVRELEQYYVDSIPVERTFNAAIGSMLSEIDPYTEYYTSDDREAFNSMTRGEYGGIGSYIMERNGGVYISAPFEDSPAATAGLRAGDLIVGVDTVDVRKKNSTEVTRLLKGDPGTPVTVKVVRPYVGSDSLLSFTFNRRKLNLPSVPYSGVVRDSIGYIRLTSFMEKSAQEVGDALRKFKDDPRVKGVVLDLRGNGGGLLESAVEIVNYFVPKGTEVLRTRGKDKGSEKIYKTTRNPLMPDMPLAVLIDGGSASASEITAGAIQDLDRGVLIGSRSYGKGLVQATHPLPYDGMLKITTAKYYIPSGRLIQALDYSHRNADGSVARTPDSLTNLYHTRGGRPVRDGGGLTPDIEVEWDTPNRLVYNLVRENKIFDYATRFVASHPVIAPPEEFVVTDSIYADFKSTIDAAGLKYDKVCEELLSNLRSTAVKEGYMNPQVEAQFDSLAVSLTHNLDHDLDVQRPMIADMLESEILTRYYYDRGAAIQSLRRDKAMDAAASLFADPRRLRGILTVEKGKK